jgi:hypothetical protein
MGIARTMPGERSEHDFEAESVLTETVTSPKRAFLETEETLTDPDVQLVREWFQRQPFSLRILTLLLFMVEAVEEEFGEERKRRKALRMILEKHSENYRRRREQTKFPPTPLPSLRRT